MGSMLAVAFSVSALTNFSKAASDLAANTEASAQRIINIFGEASNAVGDFIDENARALAMSKSAAASFAATYGNLFSVWADVNTNVKLTTEYLSMTAVVASQTGRTVEDVSERIRSGLLGNTEAVEDLGIFVNVKTIEMTQAFARVADGRSWEQLTAYEQAQVRSLAILEQATNRYGNTVANNMTTARAQYTAAFQDFQATWGQVINTILLPVLQIATQILNILTSGLQIIAGLTGKTLDFAGDYQAATINTGNAIDNSVGSQKNLTKAIKKSADEQKKLLAGFDDLQILSSSTAKNVSPDSSGSASPATVTAPIGGGGASMGESVGGSLGADQINAELAAITASVGVALAAVGLILLLSGNIGWGIGFIIAGASLFAVSVANFYENRFAEPISIELATIMGIIGVSLLAIGLMLLFVGNIPWGIGFIVAGAGMFSVVEIAAGDAGFKESEIQAALAVITAAAGMALVAIGLVLIACGNIPFGIGFIAGGAVTFAVAEAKAGKAGFKESEIQAALAVITTAVGAALVSIGLILLSVGNLPLGIGFIVAGAGTFSVGEEKISSSDVPSKIKKTLSEIKTIAGGALLALGLICMLTITGIPLGLGLILAGGTMLATSKPEDLSAVKNKVETFLKNNQELVDGVLWAMVIIGVILLCMGIIPLGLGAILAGGTALAKNENPDYQNIKNKITKFFEENTQLFTVAAGAFLVIGIILMLSGVGFLLGLGLVVAGAIILAEQEKEDVMLVTNKISTFFSQNKALINIAGAAFLILGIILCLSGVALPLGISLVAAGAVILTTELQLNWGAVGEKINNFFAENKELIIGVSVALLIIGVILVFACPAALGLGIALIIVAGALLVTAVVQPDWTAIGTQIKNFIKDNSDAIIAMSTAMLIIGIVLIFCCPAALGLGLALIISAGALLATAVEFDWGSILDSLKTVWQNIKDWWDKNVAQIFTADFWKQLGVDMLNGLIAGVEAGINGVIWAFESMVNFLIKALNKISITVPDWVPGIGGSTFGFNLKLADFGEVEIPRVKLAKGGIVPYRTYAEIGEEGQEMVLPLETHTEWMDILADRVIQRMGGGSSTVVLEIDGREFGRAVIEQGTAETRRIGTRLVTV